MSCDSSILKNALSQTVLATSKDDARPVLTGLYFREINKKMHLVATDSYRLAEKIIEDAGDEIDVLIPASSINDLLKLLDEDGETSLLCDSQQVEFKSGDARLVTRLIDGKFPDYKKLIPESFNVTAVVDKNELKSITKASSLFAKETAGSVRLEINEDKESLSINSTASQLGENAAHIKTEAKGTGEITLNSRFLVEALNVIPSEKVKIGFNGKLDPFVIKDPEDSNYQHIIMPIKS